MATKIRLQRHGRKKRPFYHIVIADVRAPRDGKFIEKIGTYDPNTVPATINLDRERAFHWVMTGAQPTDTVRAILRYNGVMFRKHLQRGVRKGAFSQEEADKRYEDWITAKASKIAGRKDALSAAAADEAAKREAAERQKNIDRYGADEPEVEETPVEKTTEEAVADEAITTEDAQLAVEEATVEPDDLTKVEGIGPKISEVLGNAGIKTFADLAGADVEKIKEILAAENLQRHIPDTWPKQAEMANEGKWDELKVWQDELDGGKVVE